MRTRSAPASSAIGLGVGDRRQARLAEGAAHLDVGDVAHHLGHRRLDAGEARAQLVGATGDLDVTVARLRGQALGGADGRLGGALGGAGRLAGILRLAARGIGHAALVGAGLVDTGLLGIAGRGEPGLLGIDAGLLDRLLGDDAVDLVADFGQAVALAQPHRGGRRRAGAHRVAVPAPDGAFAGDELLAGLQARSAGPRRSRRWRRCR